MAKYRKKPVVVEALQYDAFQNLPNAGRKLIRGDSDLYIIYPGNT